MSKPGKKYLDNNFKKVLTEAVEAGITADAVESESFGSVVSKIYSDKTIDNSTASPEAHLERKEAEVEREKPDLKERQRNAQRAQEISRTALIEYIVDVTQTDRARGIRLAQIASRYTFAKTEQKNGWISGVRLESGRKIASSLFSALSQHIHGLTDLEANIERGENDGIVRSFGGRKPFVPKPEDWKQASSALFDTARRQTPKGATHGMSLSLWNRLLERAPASIARAIVHQAKRRITRLPGHSAKLIETVEKNALRFG